MRLFRSFVCSNNTNKLSPQELDFTERNATFCSNNTNKLSPQELKMVYPYRISVQIIQINLVLKNYELQQLEGSSVQIIQINLVLKNLQCFFLS